MKIEDTKIALNLIIETLDKLRDDIATGSINLGQKQPHNVSQQDVDTIKSYCHSIEQRLSTMEEIRQEVIVEKVEIPKPFINHQQLNEMRDVLRKIGQQYNRVKMMPPQEIKHTHRFTNWISLTLIFSFSICAIAYLWQKNSRLKYTNEYLQSFHTLVRQSDKELALQIDTMLLYNPTLLPAGNNVGTKKEPKGKIQSSLSKMRN